MSDDEAAATAPAGGRGSPANGFAGGTSTATGVLPEDDPNDGPVADFLLAGGVAGGGGAAAAATSRSLIFAISARCRATISA